MIAGTVGWQQPDHVASTWDSRNLLAARARASTCHVHHRAGAVSKSTCPRLWSTKQSSLTSTGSRQKMDGGVPRTQCMLIRTSLERCPHRPADAFLRSNWAAHARLSSASSGNAKREISLNRSHGLCALSETSTRRSDSRPNCHHMVAMHSEEHIHRT